jgi:hypothetical protein
MNLKRGAAAGAGNTKLEERIFVRIKASKSRGFVCGIWLRLESEQDFNVKGACCCR